MSALRREPNPVKWWMVAMVTLATLWITGALTCIGVGQELQAQTVAADSATLRKLAEWRASDNYDFALCLATHREGEDSSIIVIDSIVGVVEGPPCPPGTGGLAGNAAPDMPQEVALAFGQELLKEYPEFQIACAIHGTKRVTFHDGNTLLVPVVWCAHR